MPTANPMRSTSKVTKLATLRGGKGATKRAGSTANVNELDTIVFEERVRKVIAGGGVPTRVLSRGLAKLRGQVSPPLAARLKKALVAYEKGLKMASQGLVKEVVRLEPKIGRRSLNSFFGDMLKFDQFSNPPINIRDGRVNIPEVSATLRPVDNTAVIARARRAGEAFKAKVLAQPDMLSAEDAAGRVGKRRQTINDQRLAGKIIGLSFGSDRFRYPEWQFHDNVYGKPLEIVVDALGDADAWEKWRFFVTEDGMLAGKAPVDVMQSGELPLERVIRAAKAFSER